MQDLEAQFPSSVREVANLTKGETSRPVEKKQAELEPTAVRSNHRGAWLGLALVGVVVAGLVWWMVDGRSYNEETASDQEGRLAPMLTESSAGTAKPASAAAAVKPEASAPSVLAQSAASEPVVAPVKPAVVASAPAVAAQAKAPEKAKTASAPAASTVTGAGSVRLVTKGDSWVSITDADGNKLVYQLLTDGTEKTVSGKAPIKVVLGHASNVQLYFNGQPVNFASKIKGETAKIELK
jgi:cytoskeleton protein RodZ